MNSLYQKHKVPVPHSFATLISNYDGSEMDMRQLGNVVDKIKKAAQKKVADVVGSLKAKQDKVTAAAAAAVSQSIVPPVLEEPEQTPVAPILIIGGGLALAAFFIMRRKS